MKLSSDDLPDSGSSPSESDVSPPSVTNSTSPSNTMLSPLSPIRSPTAEESPNSVPSQMAAASPELDALLAPVIDSSQVSLPAYHVDTPDSQVNSSAPQVSETLSAMTTTLLPLQLPSDQVTSVSDISSPACSAPDGSPPSEPDIPHNDIPVSPESPASLSSPQASSPPPDLQSHSGLTLETGETKILCSLLSESEECSSTTLPASASDAAASDVSGAETMLVDDDSEVQSGEKLVESTECSAEPQEACSDVEMSPSASAKGTAFRNDFDYIAL